MNIVDFRARVDQVWAYTLMKALLIYLRIKTAELKNVDVDLGQILIVHRLAKM